MDPRQPVDIYDKNAPLLRQRGYHPLPIAPLGHKVPKCPVLFHPRRGRYYGFTGWQEQPSPTSAQPYANIGVRMGNGLVAFDFDDNDAALIISAVFPESPVNKVGKRAWTAYYRVPDGATVPSIDFVDADGALVLQVLSTGKQTVVPPSIHPDTCEPYRYPNGRSLCDTPLSELPELPLDYIKRVADLGYMPRAEPKDQQADTNSETKFDGPHADLKARAMANLDKWVPLLDIYKLQRRGNTYVGVARWRPSTTGKPLNERGLHLKIRDTSIYDFGNDQGYSALDLVMAARGCNMSAAVDWLTPLVNPDTGPDIDFEKIAAGKTGAADEKTGAPGADPGEKKFRFRLVPFQEMRPGIEPNYLVDELIPSAGLVLLWGKQKTFKSFWLLDLMLHVAMGWQYRTRAVRQGTIIYCAFEGGHGFKARIEAMRRHYSIANDTNVPLFVMPGQADLITDKKSLIAEFKAQLGDTVPLIVVLDTLNRSLNGNENTEDMTKYVRAAEAIREAFNCVVIIVHHCGYDTTHSRGHTSLPAAVDAELDVVRDERSTLMIVTVRNMRDGPEGIEVRNRAEIFQLDPDRDGRARSSIIIVPDDTDDEVSVVGKAGRKDVAAPVFVTAMQRAMDLEGVTFTPDGYAKPVRAVARAVVRRIFFKKFVTVEDDQKKADAVKRQAFKRAFEKLVGEGTLKGEQRGSDDVLWFTLVDAT